LKLFCPINNFIGETINCEWNPTDLTTGQLITIDVPDARVSQGGVDLNSPISGNKLSFTTTTPGSVLVEVAGTANGYVDSVETVTVSVQDATTTIVFAVDGTDIFTLSGLGVDTKTHNLDMTITDGSLPADVRRVSAVGVSPTGQETQLTFLQSGNVWKTGYSTPVAGQKYIVRGEIEFNDPARQNIPFSYDLITLSVASQTQRSTVTSAIIWISVFLAVGIVGLIIFRATRGKKKKRR